MRRVVCSVATTVHYQRGLRRLLDRMEMQQLSEQRCWQMLPPGSPTHAEKPYGFKAWALQSATEEGFDTLLWADSPMVPIRSMKPLWEKIEAEGAWVSRNGWANAEWCADSAYRHLFPDMPLEDARAANSQIPHVVATCFGLSMRHEVGRNILAEYLRLARDTDAFCGPWVNANGPRRTETCLAPFCAPCGPASVLGHRHDQTVLSVLAHRNGVKLTDPPSWFCYKGGEREDTIMVADGSLTL